MEGRWGSSRNSNTLASLPHKWCVARETLLTTESNLCVRVSETGAVEWKRCVCAKMGVQNSRDMQQEIVFPISK